MFDKRVPKRIFGRKKEEVAGGWRRLHNEELHNLYTSPDITYLLTYLLTPWYRILFEKLIVAQLFKNILLSCGTRRFITMLTQARHWTLS
jgi:hypothetical protein